MKQLGEVHLTLCPVMFRLNAFVTLAALANCTSQLCDIEAAGLHQSQHAALLGTFSL